MNALLRRWRRDPGVDQLEAKLAVARGQLEAARDETDQLRRAGHHLRAVLASACRGRDDARAQATAAQAVADARGRQLDRIAALVADQSQSPQQAVDRISQVLTEGGGGGRG